MARTKLAAVALLAVALLSSACEPQPKRRPRTLLASAATHYLDEWFSIENARCRLSSIARALTEPAVPTQKRVPEDLQVVAAGFQCEDAEGTALTPATVLFERTQIVLLDDRGGAHPPARSTRLEQRAPEQLAFALPSEHDGLLRERAYDARSGAPIGKRERRRARIEIVTKNDRVVLAPWPRLHDRALDHFADQLVQTLTREQPLEALSVTPEGHASLELAASLTRRARDAFGGERLVFESIDTREGQPRLSLSLRGASDDGVPLLSLEFELGKNADGQPALLRLLDPEGVRLSLSCKEAKRELARRADDARKAQGDRVRCNALSTLLPQRCAVADPKLLHEALRVGTACENHRETLLDVDRALEAPPDFTLSLQRGRGPLARGPVQRYAVTLDRSGQVQFENQRENQPVTWFEGRTSERLIGALYGLLAELQWFSRAETGSARRCNTDDERGDIFRVRASGRERTVRDRDGCRGGFTQGELDNLRTAIERVAAVRAWTAPFFSEGVGEAQIWVVAADEGE